MTCSSSLTPSRPPSLPMKDSTQSVMPGSINPSYPWASNWSQCFIFGYSSARPTPWIRVEYRWEINSSGISQHFSETSLNVIPADKTEILCWICSYAIEYRRRCSSVGLPLQTQAREISEQYPYGPIRSVSKLTKSFFSISLIEHSRNHGFVRGPDESRRVSIHSPPSLILVSCSFAQSAFSVIPGSSISCIACTLASQTSIEAFISTSSSFDFIARAVSVICSPSTSSRPFSRSASHPTCDRQSIAKRLLPPPWLLIKSVIWAANSLTNSSDLLPDPKK